MNNKPITEKYYILERVVGAGSMYIELKGEPFGYEGCDLFLAQIYDAGWFIVCGKTGLTLLLKQGEEDIEGNPLSEGFKTKEEAENAFTVGYRKEKIVDWIAEKVKYDGYTPRYEKDANYNARRMEQHLKECRAKIYKEAQKKQDKETPCCDICRKQIAPDSPFDWTAKHPGGCWELDIIACSEECIKKNDNR